MRHIFATKLLIELASKRLIFSIDESWFNRSLKKEYSWLPWNKFGPLLNINSFGRCSLILAIGSDGEWMAMAKTNTVKSDDYINFLTLFGYIMSLRGIDLQNDWIITMDNASIHSWTATLEIIRKMQINAWFLTPYSPSLAPVEIAFKYIKSKLRSLSSFQFNFSKIKGQKVIIEVLKSISKSSILKAWIATIKEWKRIHSSNLKPHAI